MSTSRRLHQNRAVCSSTARRRALPLCALLVLSGCTVGPDFTKPKVTLNESWSAKNDARISTQATADSRWWKAFNDTVLDRLIELAYRQNLPLQIAGLRIMEARAQLGVATGMQWPQMQAAFANASAVGLTKYQSNFANIKRNFFNYQLGFDAVWELDFWGKYRRGVEAEAAGLLASVADYDSALVSLTAEVARTYAVIRTFQVLIDQAKQNAKLQEQCTANSRKLASERRHFGARCDAGHGAARKHPRNDSRAADQRASSPAMRSARCSDNPPEPSTLSSGDPRTSRRRPPRSRSAYRRICCDGARTSAAPSSTPPRSVRASASRRPSCIRASRCSARSGCRRTTAGLGSHNLFSPDSLFYSVGPRVNWPFFNYGRIQNGVRVEDARFQQALVNYRNTVLKAAQEAEDALTGFLNAQEAMVFAAELGHGGRAVAGDRRDAIPGGRRGLPARARLATFPAAASRTTWPRPGPR